MKNYQIEKVQHSPFSSVDTVSLVSYYPANNKLAQTNFATEEYAKTCISVFQVGMWRVKQQINNN